PGALRRAFEARHRQLYGYATGESVECVNLRVVARVRDTGVELPLFEPAGGDEKAGAQQAWFPWVGEVRLPLYQRAALGPARPVAFPVKQFLKRVPAARLREGDVWFLNLPEVGGNHLPDVKAIRPVFAGDRLVAFAINLAHWADIGGAVPGSYVPWATDCYQEGVRISPIRLFSARGPE